MASTYLSKTFGSAGTSDKIKTISAWIKRATTGTENSIITAGASLRDLIRFETSGAFRVRLSNGVSDLTTNRLFRDISAWYHIVVAFDTTQATASDRIKIYVNGLEETSFSTTTYPSPNQTLKLGTANPNHIGNDSEQTSPYFNGSMSHFHFIDGLAYDASAFGQFDANGIWTPNASPSVTYGTNGFFLDFADSTSMGNDVSGENNDFTVGGGDVTQTLDTPSDNFCTLNPLNSSSGTGFSDGNLTYTYASASWKSSLSTIGVSKGKWYMEVKYVSGLYGWFGVCSVEQANFFSSTYMSDATTNPTGIAYGVYAGLVQTNATTLFTSSGDSVGTIIGIALDLDNDYIYFSKGGVFVNSGDPTSGASGTGGFALPNKIALADYVFGASAYSGTVSSSNYGNGYFGTTEIVSPENDSAGLGKFAYAVPAGYYALNTKNLAEFG